ncbi:uracil-DNA glycosylase family protein [Legionella pneumophila serogroup 1]|uniref:uracil-DNA glycosylase family protein n=1 Tax=Legionella pneumophila TaxID=446 RepID=UPI0039C0B1A6
MNSQFESLLKEVRNCKICKQYLPLGPRPIIQLNKDVKILIAGQAPGKKVHETGIPFNDASGDRLRDWMGIDKNVFYDAKKIAILPMGFCYPGRGKSGDLPPMPECAATWRKRILGELSCVELTLVIGQYAIDWHLGNRQKESLTATVKNWEAYWPTEIVLPHPSPRNNIWLKKNPWFEQQILPILKKKISSIFIYLQ